MTHAAGFLDLVAQARKTIRECTPQDVQTWRQAGHAFHLIDVREDSEWAIGHAMGATHIGKGVIERDIEHLIPDRNAEIVLYCGGGYRSALAAEALQRMGYTRVVSMDGGYKAWCALGLPTTAADAR